MEQTVVKGSRAENANAEEEKDSNEEQEFVERFLEGEIIPTETWTTKLKHVHNMTYSVVEAFQDFK